MRTDWRPSGNGLWSGSETEARITAQTAAIKAPRWTAPAAVQGASPGRSDPHELRADLHPVWTGHPDGRAPL